MASSSLLEPKPVNINKPIFVVAVDGSPKSFRALTFACEDLCRVYAASEFADERPRLHVCTVIGENCTDAMREDSVKLLARCSDLADKNGVDVVEHLTVHKKAGVALVELVTDLGAHRIYVGDRRRSSLSVFLLGSCSKYVNENVPSTCEVRIINTTETFH